MSHLSCSQYEESHGTHTESESGDEREEEARGTAHELSIKRIATSVMFCLVVDPIRRDIRRKGKEEEVRSVYKPAVMWSAVSPFLLT